MPVLMTRAEAAASARVCVKTIDALIARPNGPRVTRIGRRVLIHADSLSDYLVAHSE